MAVYYKKLPTSEYDVSIDMNFKSALTYESEYEVKKKYQSIYSYSDFDDADDAVPHDSGAHQASRFCRMWSYFITLICYLILFLTLPVSGWFCFRTVHHYERLVIFRLGHLIAAKGPGVVLVLPCIDRISKVDLRMKAFSVPPQKILTSDNAAIEVGADIFYRIYDAVRSVSRIQDLDSSTRVLSQTLLQTSLAKETLADIESNRQGKGQSLLEKINAMTRAWGMEVGRVEISQIKVIQGPSETSCQAHNLLKKVTPALFPPGSNAPILSAQETSCTPTQLIDLQREHMELAGFMPQSVTPAPCQGPAVLDVDSSGTSSAKSADLNKTKLPLHLNTPHDVIHAVRAYLGTSLVSEFGVLYKFVVTGENGGKFFLDLKHGSGSADEGEPPGGNPDVTLTLTMDALRRILSGDLSAFSAYMTDELSVEGDVHAATRLAKLVDYIN